MLEEKIEYWLWCVLIMGISNRGIVPLMKKYPDAKELYQLMHEPDCDCLTAVQKKRVSNYSMEDVQKIMDYCTQHQIGLMTWYSEYYPEQLRNIYNPPALFFYRGNPAFLKNEKFVTVVGTRHPSEYSRYAASRLCKELAEKISR